MIYRLRISHKLKSNNSSHAYLVTHKVVSGGQVSGKLHRVGLVDVNGSSLDPVTLGLVTLPSSFIDLDPLGVERAEVRTVTGALSEVGHHGTTMNPQPL